MKMNFLLSILSLFILVFLVASSQASSRFLATQLQHEEEKSSSNNIIRGNTLTEMKGSYSFDDLMGLEVCESGDEECLKRRVVAEAHLDYIYTQHHSP